MGRKRKCTVTSTYNAKKRRVENVRQKVSSTKKDQRKALSKGTSKSEQKGNKIPRRRVLQQSVPRKSLLDSKPLSSDEVKFGLKVSKSIKTNMRDLVSNVYCIDDDTLLIGRMSFGNITKIKINETEDISIIKDYPFPKIDFYDFCFDKAEDQILFSNRKNKCIMSISSADKLKTLKSFKPLCPACLTISQDNFLFIGLSESYSTKENKVNQLVKMDKKGNIVLRILSYQDGHRYFVFPHRCCINPVNNEIILLDSRGCFKNEGVIGFSSTGEYRFSYTGIGKNSFQPRGLTCSPNGNIICSNDLNGDIHILQPTGRLLYIMERKSLPIFGKPWGLYLDRLGHLLIGTMKEEEEETAKIYITKFTGEKQAITNI